FYCISYPSVLHSFPTRRSSDLPEKRRAALRYDCCHRTAQSGRRFSGGTAANFFPHCPPNGAFARSGSRRLQQTTSRPRSGEVVRSEEHTSELQSLAYLVCRLLL